MKKFKFISAQHEQFMAEALSRTKCDHYHQAFFYLLGLTSETRDHISSLFDFQRDSIRPDGLNAGWQTSATARITRLAFNLWNGYTSSQNYQLYTPEDLFACEYALYFMEALKLRYPEFCHEGYEQI